MSKPLTYLSHYPQHLQDQIQRMQAQNQLGNWLRSRYPNVHSINNDKDLRDYAMDIKNHYMKKTQPLSKVVYDNKIHIVNHALGLHSYVSRVQGGKLKSKNELRVSDLFKHTPEPFLNMIVVHELAHLKEKDHNKAFYKLCNHMLPDYHQLEFEVRVYLTELEHTGYVFTQPS
ncbi:MAG TPA: metal-dependent hydrolase [Alteromonas sp.]|nr:metal-dependent hydrolase [Alteromonadaceae bacterium]MAX43589.1 metal-dependent hydrolase [Alteromonadaceae bacterium]HBY40609.1 metal-dependent hydrolase [Alteromonas sp.]|tara:strand:+ start:375 stop:893 length:519 start_codon:yes stop_codon:yes gene_type:complete